MPPDPEPGRLSAAEEAFVGFLSRQGRGESADFDALCAEHPSLADELRRMHSGWQRAAGFFGDEERATLSERIVAAFGEEALPADSLPTGSGLASRYTVRGEVARGGMGVILDVWDSDLRRRLAMKTLRVDPASPPGSRPSARLVSRFLEEAQVTGQLEHPGIVPVHELGLDLEGQVYFTMPLIRGRDLGHIFKLARNNAEGWSTTRALHVLLRVTEAMASAHARGVLHRDLKPANVMVGPYEETYVMDWGLARVLGAATDSAAGSEPARGAAPETTVQPEALRTLRADTKHATPDSPLVTRQGDVVGTPAYMSPEQARGDQAQVTERSDVYCVGAMLHELLVGSPPYLGALSDPEPHAIVARILAGPAPSLQRSAPDVPAELAAVCDRALAYDPSGRYPSMLALADDLRAYLETRVVRAYRTGAVAELGKWVQRNRALATTAAAALVTLVVGLVATWSLMRVADAERTRVLGLSDLKRVADLRRRADALWPAVPARIVEFDAWLAEAARLRNRLVDDHEPTLQAMRTSGRTASADGEVGWTFDDTQTQWHHDALTELAEGIVELTDPDDGLVTKLLARREFAATVEERTVLGPEVAERWRAATKAVASSPHYGGLALRPQLGLVPLGPDPASQLWEFGHLQTGDIPERDARGRLVLHDTTGLVLVLLPGGTFCMGAQALDPASPNYDPEASKYEAPPHTRDVEPFFLSKYEMTQGQWVHFTGSNPAHYFAGGKTGGATYRPTLLHPVETVSWHACRETLAHLALALPTEAQWEYAARAGTSTPWWTGAEKESLLYAANVADKAATRAGASWPDIQDWPELDDGYVVHAPVGTFRPNPFGLHEITGNVQELCADEWETDYSRYVAGEAPSDEETAYGVFRGGNFGNRATFSRSAHRNSVAKGTGENPTGLRPARALNR